MFIVLSSTLFQKFRNLHGLFAFLSHSVGVVALSEISHVPCRVSWVQQMTVFPVIASLPPKNNVCEPEWQNNFPDVKPFALMLANQNKG